MNTRFTKKSMYDVIVVGGGAAGMFAAITAARNGARVALFEQNERLGKKLAITGKGRCNVTNHCEPADVLKNVPHNARFLFSAVNRFPPQAMEQFLEDNGCPVKVERGNRVFPASDRSFSVIDALERAMREGAVTLRRGRVLSVLEENGQVCGVRTAQEEILSKRVILCTGGASYPATGSRGDGYRMAQALGHTVVPPVGSLVPLEQNGTDCVRMQGLSLRNVGVKLQNAHGKIVYEDFGELLFTHFGVSGPTVLSASAHMEGDEGYTLLLDLKPALDEQKLDARILRDFQKYQNRNLENALLDLYPRTMIPVLLARLALAPDTKTNFVTKQQRHALLELTKRFPIQILKKRPVEEAIITSGGVKVSEVDPKTMQSKKIAGLYFAGELLDCDAYTGGFNLQIAWSTAFAAGTAVCAANGKEEQNT